METRRQQVLHKIGCNVRTTKRPRKNPHPQLRKQGLQHVRLATASHEPLPPAPADVLYQISDDQRNHVDIRQFVIENAADAACDNFISSLKAHLLRRLPGGEAFPEGYEPNSADICSVRIRQDRLYSHQTLRVNYTTYDMRRDQDSINPRTHPDIMMYSPDSNGHPFLYARVLGIFHVNVYRAGEDMSGADDTEPQREHVVWVRWFDLDTTAAPGGFATCRLHRLQWAQCDDDAFGFVDPKDVLRAAHLIPAFAHGTQAAWSAPVAVDANDESVSEDEGDDRDEWRCHYVNL